MPIQTHPQHLSPFPITDQLSGGTLLGLRDRTSIGEYVALRGLRGTYWLLWCRSERQNNPPICETQCMVMSSLFPYGDKTSIGVLMNVDLYVVEY